MITLLIPALCALGGVCVGALVTRWLHRSDNDSSLRDPLIRLVSKVSLDRRRSLALVESPERTWLLGMDGRHITLLSEMEGGADVPPPAGRHSFGRTLTETLEKTDQENWESRLDDAAQRIFGQQTTVESGLDPLMALASSSPSVVRHSSSQNEKQ
jgi:flagellar biogenesis protein FliO